MQSRKDRVKKVDKKIEKKKKMMIFFKNKEKKHPCFKLCG